MRRERAWWGDEKIVGGEAVRGTSETLRGPPSRRLKKRPMFVAHILSIFPSFFSFFCCEMWRGCQQGLGKHSSPSDADRRTVSSQFGFFWMAVCVNYEPAPSKTRQTSASWLAHKFTRHLAAHHPLCCLNSNRNNKRAVLLPSLLQVPVTTTNRCLPYHVLAVIPAV